MALPPHASWIRLVHSAASDAYIYECLKPEATNEQVVVSLSISFTRLQEMRAAIRRILRQTSTAVRPHKPLWQTERVRGKSMELLSAGTYTQAEAALAEFQPSRSPDTQQYDLSANIAMLRRDPLDASTFVAYPNHDQRRLLLEFLIHKEMEFMKLHPNEAQHAHLEPQLAAEARCPPPYKEPNVTATQKDEKEG